MNTRILCGALALSVTLITMPAFSQTVSPSGAPPSPAGSLSGNGGAEPCSQSPICAWGRGRDVISHEVAPSRSGFHLRLSVCVAGRIDRRRLGRRDQFERAPVRLSAQPRGKTAVVRVRPESQACPHHRRGRDRPPEQGARHGDRRAGQHLDLRREWRHGDETQSRGEAPHDPRREGAKRGLG